LCNEGGPYYGACTAPTYTRPVTYDCQAATTQACAGTITGTFFDASDLSACPADPSTLDPSLKVGGGSITATSASISYNGLTAADGRYTIAGVRSPDTYNLTVNPGGAYVPAAKFSCQGTSATLTGQAESFTRDFGFWKVYGGWYQGVGGGIYGGSGITSNIPGTVAAADRYLIDQDAGGRDGLAYYKSGTINLGTYPNITVSETGWNANSGYSGDNQDYNYWLAKMGIYTKTVWNGTDDPTSIYVGGVDNYQIFSHTGDVTFNYSPAAGQRMIFLVNGNVTVNGNITVPKVAGSPSFLAIIASGTITFNSNVTSAQGLFVGNAINVASTGDTATEVRFSGEGSFVGWSSISLNRDRGVTNNTASSEIFTYRPDLLINAPDPMKVSSTVFRLETP